MSICVADPVAVAMLYGTTYQTGGFRLTVTDAINGSNVATKIDSYVNQTYVAGPLVPGSQLFYTIDMVRSQSLPVIAARLINAVNGPCCMPF